MSKHKICVYPYGKEFEPVIEHSGLLSTDYEIRALVAPKGWRLDGARISLNGGVSNVIVRSSLEDVIDDVDTLLIPEFFISERFIESVLKNVIAFVPRLRKIICGVSLSRKQLSDLKNACESTNCILDLRSSQIEMQDYELLDSENELMEFNVPIIAIAGLWENTDKFKVSLALREKMIGQGYKVSQIGARNYCDILGFHSYPVFMNDPSVDEAKKVIYFNKYVKKIIDDERPDVVLIGVPGELSAYSTRFVGKFGVTAYLIFKAILVDFLVVCLFYDHTADEYLKLVSESCKFKYDAPVDCYHMSGSFVDMLKSEERRTIVMEKVPPQIVSESLFRLKEATIIPIVDIYDKKGIQEMYDLVMRKFNEESVDILC